jgi:pimeloyl-ACP methyl ester carboxylesterase
VDELPLPSKIPQKSPECGKAPVANIMYGIPVLLYHGKRDWMAGPDQHTDIVFPEMKLWQGDAGHMPFLENRDNLIKAIRSY